MIDWESFCKLGKPQYPFVLPKKESRIERLEAAVLRCSKLNEVMRHRIITLENRLNKLEEK